MQNEAAAGKGPLLDIRDLSFAFHSAFLEGGARGLLDLLSLRQIRQAMLEEIERLGIANATNAASIIRLAPKAQIGLWYDPEFLADHGYTWAAALKPPHDYQTLGKLSMVQGSLWWIRHWAGEYLAEQMRKSPHIDAAAVIWWTQQQQRCRGADFVSVAVEHAVIWYVIASERLISGEVFPTTLVDKWCHRYSVGWGEWLPTVRTDLGRECRHATGHAVYYSIAMRDRPSQQLHGFSSFQHTLRVGGAAGLQLDSDEVALGIRICANASHPSLVSDCYNGLFHSYVAMAPAPNFTWRPSTVGGTADAKHVAAPTPLTALPEERRRYVGHAPIVNYTAQRPRQANRSTAAYAVPAQPPPAPWPPSWPSPCPPPPSPPPPGKPLGEDEGRAETKLVLEPQ